MKNGVLLYTFLLVGILLTACAYASPETAEPLRPADFANWEAWSIVWEAAETFDDVTVTWEEKQKTFFPEQEGFVFIAIRAAIVNIGRETEEIRFPQGPIYLTDADQNKYELVGVTNKDTILMSPPYLMEDKTHLTATRWEDGRFFSVAYQVDSDTWHIQATPNSPFHLDFLFVVPKDVRKYTLHFANGMQVIID
jgi:hypothetical protein